MTIATLTLPMARRNPVQAPRRDIVLASGEGLELTVRLVQADVPGSPSVDVLGVGPVVRMMVWSGRDVWRSSLTVHPTELGRADLSIPAQTGAAWPRQCLFEIQAVIGNGTHTLCRGTLSVLSGPNQGPVGVPLLDDFYAPARGDDYQPLEA